MSRTNTAASATVTIAPCQRGAFHAFRVFDSRTRRAFYFDTMAQAIAHAHAIA